MAKKLISDLIILNDKVLTVTLTDVSPSGYDGRKFRIEILDENKKTVSDEEREVEISGTALAMMPYQETDLYSYLIQFRKDLPNIISSANIDFFEYPAWSRDAKLYQVGKLIEVFFKADNDSILFPDYIRNSIEIEYSEILSILEFYENNGILKGYELGSVAVIAEDNWYNKLNLILDKLKPVEIIDKSGLTVVPPPATMTVETITADAEITIYCQIKMNNNVCGSNVYHDGLCICHFDDRKKNDAIFNAEINSIIKSTNINDFTRFIFPDDFRFPNTYFNKISIFNECKFYTHLNMSKYSFKEELDIQNCQFIGGVNLSFSSFENDIIFDSNNSLSSYFQSSLFYKGFIFGNNIKDIDKLGSTNLKNIIFKAPDKIFFRNIFLPNLLVEGTDISNISIVNFTLWNKNSLKLNFANIYNLLKVKMFRFFPWFRVLNYQFRDEQIEISNYKLGDEYILNSEINRIKNKETIKLKFISISECYQRLQKNMLNVRNYSKAGFFHIREMELQRSKFGYWGRCLSSFSFYKYLSFYGESILIPISFLISMLILIPIITMLFMGHNEYYITWKLNDIGNALYGWLNEFTYNLEKIFYLKNSIFEYKCRPHNPWKLLFIFEKFFSVILISFIVVAFRRRFKRY